MIAMPYILGVLEEEQERLSNQRNDYMAILEKLPRKGGSIVEKEISGHKYHYFAYREGKKVRTEYIKKKDLDEFRKKIAERDRIKSAWCRMISIFIEIYRYEFLQGR